jgi:signal transduction histidine kinase
MRISRSLREPRDQTTPGEPLLHDAEELWLRLAWFTRVRWFVPVGLYLMERLAEVLLGRVFPRTEIGALLGMTLAVYALYVAILVQWRPRLRERLIALRVLAHVQVLIDLVILVLAFALTGGTQSPFWPFASLTVLSASLFFARRMVIGYAAFAVALFAAVGAYQGQLNALNLLLLAFLLGMTVAIAGYIASRLEQAHDAEIALERMRFEKTAAEEIARRKDEVLSLVSHELRNPLSAMRGYVQLASRKPISSSGITVKDTLARIDGQVSLMARLVSDLYDLASTRRGQLPLHRERCDLAALTREVARRFGTLYPTLAIRTRGPDAIPGELDAQRIEQLVTNLVGNAVKYAGERCCVQIELATDGARALLTVADDGPGIPPEKLPRIFEAFERGEEDKPGLGLGLALCREIARAHGGEIEAESELGQGTTIRVRLELRHDDAQVGGESAQPS